VRITDLKTTFRVVPPEKALLHVTKTRATLQFILVSVVTDEGLTGYGYTYTDGYGGHAVKAPLDTGCATYGESPHVFLPVDDRIDALPDRGFGSPGQS